MQTVAHLGSRFRALCAKLGTRRPFHTTAHHDGTPHVEVIRNRYHYVVTERGMEHERRQTHDADELLYWLMSSVVFSLAVEYELRHRVKGQDFRRLLFQKQIELMTQLSPQWAEHKADEIQAILATHPYDDIACG